ncbi:MAG: VOC family protein [Rhodospirillales bacterium]|nr:VOC family protein [Rhodospirillales bacterium]
MAVTIDRLDHVVFTVASIDRTLAFYQRVLGMEPVTFAGGRRGLAFGRQKINLHEVGREFSPRAHRATAGSADLCFIAAVPLDQVIAHLAAEGIAIEQGPVPKSGATGPITSVYFRDPDLNLVEVSTYDP